MNPSSLSSLPHLLCSQVEVAYSGPLVGKRVASMLTCRSSGPRLMVHVTKLYPKADCSTFDAYGRVMCGTIRTGMAVRVLGEHYLPEDEEDMAVKVWKRNDRTSQSRQ